MQKFQLESSVWGQEIYPRWANNEISLIDVIAYAVKEGVNDPELPAEEQLLNHVMGFIGEYIVTYDAAEDIIDVWKQLNE